VDIRVARTRRSRTFPFPSRASRIERIASIRRRRRACRSDVGHKLAPVCARRRRACRSDVGHAGGAGVCGAEPLPIALLESATRNTREPKNQCVWSQQSIIAPTAVDRRHTDERSPAPSPTPTPKRRSPRRSSLNSPPPHASPCRTLTAPPRGTLWIRTTTRTDDPSARPVNAHGPRHERCASVENTRAASAWTAPVHPRPSRRRAPMGK